MGTAERLPLGRDTCCAAATTGDLEMLQLASEHDCPWDLSKVISFASSGNHVLGVRWLFEQMGTPYPEYDGGFIM